VAVRTTEFSDSTVKVDGESVRAVALRAGSTTPDELALLGSYPMSPAKEAVIVTVVLAYTAGAVYVTLTWPLWSVIPDGVTVPSVAEKATSLFARGAPPEVRVAVRVTEPPEATVKVDGETASCVGDRSCPRTGGTAPARSVAVRRRTMSGAPLRMLTLSLPPPPF
jgi:hypothetical protein